MTFIDIFMFFACHNAKYNNYALEPLNTKYQQQQRMALTYECMSNMRKVYFLYFFEGQTHLFIIHFTLYCMHVDYYAQLWGYIAYRFVWT